MQPHTTSLFRFKDRDVVQEHRQRFPMVHSLCTTVRYHLGSLAMGAFVLALIKFIRYLMLWLDSQVSLGRRAPAMRLGHQMSCLVQQLLALSTLRSP